MSREKNKWLMACAKYGSKYGTSFWLTEFATNLHYRNGLIKFYRLSDREVRYWIAVWHIQNQPYYMVRR